MKKIIALDLHIAIFICYIMSSIQFTLDNYIQGVTTNYVIHSIVIDCLATKCCHNLYTHLGCPITMVAKDFCELLARLIIYNYIG